MQTTIKDSMDLASQDIIETDQPERKKFDSLVNWMAKNDKEFMT